MVGYATVLYGCMSLYFIRVNARRRKGDEDKRVEGMSEEEVAEMGDRSPRFVFTI